MATYYISAESPSWSGSPRVNTNQYIQDEIDSHGAGNTYILNAGTHRGQDIYFQAGDELILAESAVVSGAEDIGTGGWTQSGSEWYKSVSNVGDYQGSAHDIATGYDPESLEMMILDGVLYPWYTSGSADDGGCTYSGSTVYIGINPATLSTIEICRKGTISGPGVLLAGESAAERAKIYGYATEDGVVDDPGIGLSGTNPVIRDLEVYSFSGYGLGAFAGTTVRNVTVHDCGELGIGGSVPSGTVDDVTIAEGCWFYSNGVGGWNNGNEGGNCKWSGSDSLVLKGGLWEMGPTTNRWLNNEPPSACWFDINNDGYTIHSSVFTDEDSIGWRGLFLEISYSGKVYNNTLMELAYNVEDQFWARGLLMSSTGAQATDTIYDTIEIYGNLLYRCNGGIGGVQNRFGSEQTYAMYDPSSCKNWNIHNNTTYFDGTESGTVTGMIDATEDVTVPVENNVYEDNIYLVASAESSFSDDQDGGSGSDLSWAAWNSAGHDDVNGQYLIDHGYDPDPFNGGAM